MSTLATERRAPGLDRSDIPPRQRRGRAPWMVFGSIVALAAIGFVTLDVVSLLAHEERDEHATIPAAAITLVHIDNDGGPVVVEPTEGDSIDLAVHVSDGLQHTGVSWNVDGSTLDVRGTCPILNSLWCHADVTIAVPRDIAVRVESGSGRVTIEGRDGAVDVDADDGRVELRDVTGPVQVTADNGRIEGTALASTSVHADSDNGRIELTFVAAPDEVVATSDNGRIDIGVPQGSGPYAVEANSDNGSRTVEVATDPTASRTITARTDNGAIRIHEV